VAIALLGSSALLAAPGSAAAVARSAKSAASKCPDPSGTVKVGMTYLGSVAAQANATLGASSANSPTDANFEKEYQGGATALNNAGGIAGCKVVPVIFSSSAGSTDFNQQAQSECAAFTQDNKVIAVLAGGYETKLAAACLAKAKIPVFWVPGQNLYEPSCTDSTKNNFYAVGGVFTCRFGSFIKLWNDAGLFPKGAKVGVMVLQALDGTDQNQAVVDKLWTPQLKKLGITVESAVVTRGLSSSGFADLSAQVAQAVLKFKTDGVNVVLYTPPGAQMAASFMPTARSQDYFPNYGFTTSDSPTAVSIIGKDSVKTAVGISWDIGDLPISAQHALPPNPAITACAPWSTPSENLIAGATLNGATYACDFYNALAAGFKGATKLNAATLRKGLAKLGTSFDSAVTYGGTSKFSTKRLDSAYKAKILTWDANTKMFLVKPGPLVTIP
jgi:hypothetical protein